MANRRNPGPAEIPPVARILAMTGMTMTETIDYLNSRGVQCSRGAVQSWTRGLYRPKAEALEALWLVVRAIGDEGEPMPDEAPESSREMARAAYGMRIWWDEIHPDPDFAG